MTEDGRGSRGGHRESVAGLLGRFLGAGIRADTGFERTAKFATDAISRRRRCSAEMRLPADVLLHASGDLVGSIHHAQLRAAGAPQRPATVANEVVLMTGTTPANEALLASRIPVMQEVSVTPR